MDNFICLCIFVIIKASLGYDTPNLRSHSSSVSIGEKPILRGDVERESSESTNNTDAAMSPYSLYRGPSWTGPLLNRIDVLVGRYGQRAAKPYIDKAVEDTEKILNVLLDVVGKAYVTKYKYMKALREEAVSEAWLPELKAYVKELIQKHGRQNLDNQITPIVEKLQRRYHVRIKDIDADSYGDIYVAYYNYDDKDSGNTKQSTVITNTDISKLNKTC